MTVTVMLPRGRSLGSSSLGADLGSSFAASLFNLHRHPPDLGRNLVAGASSVPTGGGCVPNSFRRQEGQKLLVPVRFGAGSVVARVVSWTFRFGMSVLD